MNSFDVFNIKGLTVVKSRFLAISLNLKILLFDFFEVFLNLRKLPTLINYLYFPITEIAFTPNRVGSALNIISFSSSTDSNNFA